MTVDRLLATLAEPRVTLILERDKLRYQAPARAMTTDLREAVAMHCTAIIERLGNRQPNGLATPTRCVHIPSPDWIDEPPRNGMIRTVCARCGRFIGYRPEHN